MWLALKAVPFTKWIEIGITLAFLSIMFYIIELQHNAIAGLRLNLSQEQTALALDQKGRATDNAQAQAAAASAAADALTKTGQILTDQQEIENGNHLVEIQHRAVVAAADAVSGQLLVAFRAANASAAASARGASASDPAADGGSAAAGSAVDLRADVFAELVDRNNRLTDSLDESYRHGLGCQAEYGSVRARVNAISASGVPGTQSVAIH